MSKCNSTTHNRKTFQSNQNFYGEASQETLATQLQMTNCLTNKPMWDMLQQFWMSWVLASIHCVYQYILIQLAIRALQYYTAIVLHLKIVLQYNMRGKNATKDFELFHLSKTGGLEKNSTQKRWKGDINFR